MTSELPTSAGGSRRRRRSAALPLLLTVGIAVSLGLRTWSVWAQLPETVASHFGLGGRPNAFMSKEGFFIVMAIVGGGSVATLFAAPVLLRHLPASLVNIPNRDYWLANGERREAAIDRLGGLLGWMGVATALLLAVAVELALRANLHRTNFDNSTFMIFLGAYFVFVIAVLVRMKRAFSVPFSAS